MLNDLIPKGSQPVIKAQTNTNIRAMITLSSHFTLCQHTQLPRQKLTLNVSPIMDTGPHGQQFCSSLFVGPVSSSLLVILFLALINQFGGSFQAVFLCECLCSTENISFYTEDIYKYESTLTFVNKTIRISHKSSRKGRRQYAGSQNTFG